MHFLALSVLQIFNSRNLIPDLKNSHSTKSKLSVENLKAEIHSVFPSRSTFEIQDKSYCLHCLAESIYWVSAGNVYQEKLIE